nr:unnamed protein product [Digitaria exilis]
MRGVRRSARGESSRKAARELDRFVTANEVFHLTRARSELCHRTRGASSARRRRPFSTFELVSARESGRAGGAGFSLADRACVGRRHIPKKGPWAVDEMDSEAYVSQFSADGSLLVAGFRAYASLSPVVHIVNVQSSGKESHANINEIHEGLDFTADEHEDEDFGIFSVKFSKDGKEVVIGNSERSIYVYDLAANKVSVRIHAHMDDVNAVTFADKSGNVLYSGSDDSLCKMTGKAVERLSWHGSIIRDCSWHPCYPTLVTSSWDGYLARWEASGDNDE